MVQFINRNDEFVQLYVEKFRNFVENIDIAFVFNGVFFLLKK